MNNLPLTFTDIEYPQDDEALSADAVEAVEQLLTMDPSVRPSSAEVQQMSFFKTLDWENIQNMVPPFLPTPENDTDTGYFEGWYLIECPTPQKFHI